MIARHVTGRHVLLALLLFFSAVFAVNGLFVYLALHSWSGVETEHAYARGRDYQHSLDDARVQAARGWRLHLDQRDLGKGRLRLNATLLDAHRQPIDGVTLRAEVRRPTVDAYDQHVVFTGRGQGRYEADITLGAAGQWDVRLETAGHPGVPQRRHVRLWVAP